MAASAPRASPWRKHCTGWPVAARRRFDANRCYDLHDSRAAKEAARERHRGVEGS
jgi:hypothetical protein